METTLCGKCRLSAEIRFIIYFIIFMIIDCVLIWESISFWTWLLLAFLMWTSVLFAYQILIWRFYLQKFHTIFRRTILFANVLHLSLSWCFRVSHIIISIQLFTDVCLCTLCMYKKLQLIACKVLIFQIKVVISIVDSYHNPQKTSHFIG